MSDVMIVAQSFNSTRGDDSYFAERDLNNDGAVNMSDIMMIAEKFNTTVY
jgi:hypothetical protein